MKNNDYNTCNIKAVNWNGEENLYCQTHRYLADNNTSCLSRNKDAFNDIHTLQKEDIKSLQVVYPNLLLEPVGDIYVNNQKIGVLKIGDSIFETRDLGGIMLSRLNNITLSLDKCPLCGHIHSDDGKFAYTPHNPHLCMYCGNFFNVPSPSIGNELAVLFNIPSTKLLPGTIKIDKTLSLKYDLFSGQILINDQNVDTLIIDNEEVSITSFLNDKLKEEY